MKTFASSLPDGLRRSGEILLFSGSAMAVVTVHDVARRAGVSISTVSRALAAPERVAPATRMRVLAAVGELGYRPNRAASGLRRGRTGAVGLLVPDIENPYFTAVTKGVGAEARARGCGLFAVDTAEHPDLEAEELRTLVAQTDGVLLASPRADDAEIRSVAAGVPCVLMNRRITVDAAGGPEIPSVTADERQGTWAAVEHLHALGHRKIAFVGGPRRSWSQVRRAAGMRRAVEIFGDIEYTELGPYRPEVEGGYSAADVAYASGATAVLAFNDLVGAGLLLRLYERGIGVPGEISLVSFDDTYVARLAAPQLTSVGPDLHAMGSAALDLLLAIIRGKEHTGQVEVTPVLSVRGSTGPVAP